MRRENTMKPKAWITAIALALGLLATPITAMAASPHEKTVGLAAGYVSQNNSGLAGVNFTYRFSRHFRMAPEVLYAFRHSSEDALIINVNAHVPCSFDRFLEVYPLAGITYTSWNFHGDRAANGDADVTSRISRFGLNVGAGISADISTTLRVGLEIQGALVKDLCSANVMAKIAYIF